MDARLIVCPNCGEVFIYAYQGVCDKCREALKK